MKVRHAKISDLEELAVMRHILWPEDALSDHRTELYKILTGKSLSTLPLVCFVAVDGLHVIGFAEVGLRSHADGCNAVMHCGFLEGWYVKPSERNQGVGRALVVAAEDWARSQGCREMASDTWMDNEESQRAHAAMGYEVVDRCVNYRKTLVD